MIRWMGIQIPVRWGGPGGSAGFVTWRARSVAMVWVATGSFSLTPVPVAAGKQRAAYRGAGMRMAFSRLVLRERHSQNLGAIHLRDDVAWLRRRLTTPHATRGR